MSNKHLSRKSKHFRNKDAWWYETPAGFEIVVPPPPNCSGTPAVLVIRWSSIKAALKRKQKP